MGAVFYRDSSENFECSVKIEGTEYSKVKTRLILEFANRTLMFPGFIKEGRVSIKVPSLSDIVDETGTAILEIIADSTYFEAWKSKFQLKNKNVVQISEVSIGGQSPTIVVENVSVNKKPTKKRIPKKISIFKDTCSPKNKKLVENFFRSFKKLNESKTRTTKQELKKYKPSSTIQKWGNAVFVDSNTAAAKFCMMQLQKSL